MNSDSDTVRYFIEFFYEDQFPWSTSMHQVKSFDMADLKGALHALAVQQERKGGLPYQYRCVKKELINGRVILTRAEKRSTGELHV